MPNKAYDKLSPEEKARQWSKTYNMLQVLGFSEQEAEWAANRGFNLSEPIMKRIIEKREWDLKIYKLRLKIEREEAIGILSHEVNVRNQLRDMEDDDLFNLMRVIYP